jgi:site-specific DNA-methyltransferase (adenine-specific)
MSVKLEIGDCRDLINNVPSKSVDLAILDPPYYKIVKSDWDRQWKTFEEYLDWLEGICLQVKRVLKDNGSLYIFGDDARIAYIQVRLDRHFTFLNHLVWNKPNACSIHGAEYFRRFAGVSERILFYANGSDVCVWDQTGLERIKLDINNFKTLRQYFKEFQEALGCNKKQIIEKIGQRADHCFRWGSTQWDMPTPETYQELLNLHRSETFEVREYEDLRREYEDLRREYEDLRRPFNYRIKLYEVFFIPVVAGKDNTPHPTTNPRKLIRNLILCSTKENALVLDPFAGSGTTLLACRETGRNCIAFEKDPKYEPIIRKRAMLDTQELTSFQTFETASPCNLLTFS